MHIYRIVLSIIATTLCYTALLPSVNTASASRFSSLAEVADVRQSQADQWLEEGTRQYRTGQPTQAIATLQQALVIDQALQSQPKIVKTLRNLGNAYYVMTDYGRAATYYQQSLALSRQSRDRGEAAALGNLGVIAVNLSDAEM